jgi:hypothetical protein
VSGRSSSRGQGHAPPDRPKREAAVVVLSGVNRAKSPCLTGTSEWEQPLATKTESERNSALNYFLVISNFFSYKLICSKKYTPPISKLLSPLTFELCLTIYFIENIYSNV